MANNDRIFFAPSCIPVGHYLVSDGGRKAPNCGDSIDGYRDDEADQLHDRHPPRETRPAHAQSSRFHYTAAFLTMSFK